MTAYESPITMLKTVWKSDRKYLRYSKIGTKILTMFNFLLQHIAHDFEASQPLLNATSYVSSIAACGLGYKHANFELPFSNRMVRITCFDINFVKFTMSWTVALEISKAQTTRSGKVRSSRLLGVSTYG